jgi:hypothetical protein
MLLILISWAYILLLSLVYGYLTTRVLDRLLASKEPEPPHLSILALLGLGTLTTIAGVYSFLGSIGWELNLLLLLGALGYGFWQRRGIWGLGAYYARGLRANPWYLLLIMVMVTGLALLATALPPAYYDDGLYYLPFMKWMNAFPIVPGLGNLHPRLAFNSNWHLLSAVFSFSFLGKGTFNDLNGFLHILIGLYAVAGLKGLATGHFSVSNALRASMLIPTHLIVGYFNGPSADVPVIYFIWLVVVFWIQKGEKGTSWNFDRKALLIMFFSVWACTIKLSAFPIAIIPAFIFGKELLKGKGKSLAILSGMAMLLALPWMGRNLVISGYLFFPFHQIDLFSFDWKIPKGMVEEEVRYIEAFAAGESLVKEIPYPELQQMSFSEWFPKWYRDLRTANRGIFFLVIGLSLGFGIYLLQALLRYPAKLFQKQAGYLILFLVIGAGLGFWFLKAPDFRFGYAFTVLLYLLALSLLLVRLLASYRWGKYVMGAFVGLILLFYLRPLQVIGTTYAYLLKAGEGLVIVEPGPAPELPMETFQTPEGLMLYKATSNDQCWNTPLPCTPFYDIGLRLRKPSQGLAGGFRIPEANVAHYRALQIYYQQPDKQEKPTVSLNRQ